MQLAYAIVRHLKIHQHMRNHPDHVTARRQGAIRNGTHQPGFATTVDQPDPPLAKRAPQFFRCLTYSGRPPFADAQNTATLFLAIGSVIPSGYNCARDMMASQHVDPRAKTMRFRQLSLALAATLFASVPFMCLERTLSIRASLETSIST